MVTHWYLWFVGLCLAVALCHAARGGIRPPTESQKQKLFGGAEGAKRIISRTPLEKINRKKLFTGGNISSSLRSKFTPEEKEGLEDIEKELGDSIDFGKKVEDEIEAKELALLWKKQSERQKNVFKNISKDPNAISPSDLAKMNPEIFTNMKDTELEKINRAATNETRKRICMAMKKGSTSAIKKGLKKINCKPFLRELNAGKEFLEEALEHFKEKQGNVSEWLDNTWAEALEDGLLDKDMMKKIPKHLVKKYMKRFAEAAAKAGDTEEYIQRTKEALDGNFTNAKPEDVKNMGPMFSRLSTAVIDKLPDAAKAEAATELIKHLGKKDRVKRMMIAKSKKKTLPANARDWTAENFKEYALVDPDNPSVVRDQPDANVISLMDGGVVKFEGRKGVAMRERLAKIDEYKHPENITKASLKKMAAAGVASAVEPSFWDQVPKTELRGVINDGNMKDLELDEQVARKFFRECKEAFGKNDGNFDAADIEKMGKAIGKAIDADGMKKIDSDTLNDEKVMKVFRETAEIMDALPKYELIKKLKTTTDGKGIEDKICRLGALCKSLNPEDIKAMNTNKLVAKLEEVEDCNLECNTEQAAELMKQVKKKNGEFSIDNPNYDMTFFKKLRKILGPGMTPDDVRKIPADGKTPDVLAEIAKGSIIPEETIKVLTQKALAYFGFDKETSTVEKKHILLIGKLLKNFRREDLKKISISLCEDVVEELAQHDLSDVSREQAESLVLFALNDCLKKASGKLESTDVRKLGPYLLCHLPEGRLKDLNQDTVLDIAPDLQECSGMARSKQEKLKPILKTALQGNDYSKLDGEKMVALGMFLTVKSTDAEMKQIDKNVVEEGLVDIADSVKARREERDKRDKSGFKDELRQADRDEQRREINRLGARGLEARQEIRAAESSEKKRRKRASGSVLCSDIKLMSDLSSSLTVAQISSLANNEFKDCTVTLGAIKQWTSEKLTALATKAKSAWGSLGSWTANNIRDAGTIVQGLTKAEMALLTYDTTAISNLGKHSGWSSDQLTAGFAKWLSDVKSNDATTVSGSELASLGHFACGPSVTHINSFPHTSYSAAAAVIGALEVCSSDQLKAYANKAKAAYGTDISKWDVTTVQSVKHVMSGLTGNDLAVLSESQIEVIKTATIAKIPPNEFKSFTTTQIKYFTTEQAKSVTEAQQKSLSADQIQALKDAGATVITVQGGGSGGTRLQATVFGLMVAVSGAYLI